MALAAQLQKLQDIDLADIEFSRAGLWPAGLKLAVLAMVLLAVLAVGFFWQLRPLLNELHQSQAKETALKLTFEKRAQQAGGLSAWRRQHQQLQSRFEARLQQLPAEARVPGLLEDITEIALNGGLEIRSIKVKPAVAGEFFVELPLSIVLSGSYHNFGAFVSAVAALPRIVTLHNFTISGSDANALQLTIAARTYRYKN